MCAYNPGIQDISGQLRAQGKTSQSKAITEGFSGGFQSYMQNKLRNQALQGDNEGMLQVYIKDPETAKYAPPGIEKFLTKIEKGGGLSLGDNIQLNGMLTAAIKTKGLVTDQQAKAQQMALMQQQIEASKVQATQDAFITQQKQVEAAKQAEMDRINKLLSDYNPNGPGQTVPMAGGGVLRGDVQNNLNSILRNNPQARLMAAIAQQSGNPAVQQELLQNGRAGGGAPTTAMRDTDAIINSELASGKTKPDQVNARRAELLAAGGRDPESRYDMVGTYVKRNGGGDPITVFKERSTSRVGMVGKDGKFTTVDPDEYKPSTQSDANPYMDPEPFSKFAESVQQKEEAVRSLSKFMEGAKDLPQGLDKLSNRISAVAKTIMGEELTADEKKMGIARARQQRLLGALRTSILGPGVLTEIDAQRIISAVGGDVDSISTNPSIMTAVLGEIMAEKMRDYENALDVYNSNVAGRHGQAGYKQRKKVDVGIMGAPAQAAPVPAAAPKAQAASALPPGWSVRQ